MEDEQRINALIQEAKWLCEEMKSVTAEYRRRQVERLRDQGYDFREIAQIIGVNRSRISHIVTDRAGLSNTEFDWDRIHQVFGLIVDDYAAK